MVRGSTYSAAIHVGILATIVIGLPSLALLLPKLLERNAEPRVIVMPEQTAQDPDKAVEAATPSQYPRPYSEAEDGRADSRSPATEAVEPTPGAGSSSDAMLPSARMETSAPTTPLPRSEGTQHAGRNPSPDTAPATGPVQEQSAGPIRRAQAAEMTSSTNAPDGAGAPAPQATARGGAANDAIGALMAQLAEQIPRLKSLRDAVIHPEGSRTSPALEQSVKRMELRSEEGYAHAQFSLAEMHLTGDGLPKDTKKAVELLTRAAMGGYLPAQLTLGMLAAEGTIMERNLAEAHTWLAVAAEQGTKAATEVLPKLEKHMSTRDTVEARKRSFQLNRVLVIIHGSDLKNASKSELSERLRIAAALGDVESVYVLLAQGADADGADLDGRTALIEAAWRGYPRIVKALIDNGAGLAAADNTKKNALMWAAINGHAAVIANLLAAGAPVDDQDNEGITALMRASWNSHASAVRVLIEAGSHLEIKDDKGLTALDYSVKAGNKEVLQILRDAISRG